MRKIYIVTINFVMMAKIKYSVVVPVYNEGGNIKILDEEIKKTMSSVGSYEIIYINDGSSDETLRELKLLKKIKIIDLNRNYGQATALDAGFKEASGDIIVSLDGDLQNDPADIPKLLEKMQRENLDVVAGWRKHRQDKGGIKALTLIGRAMRKFLIKDAIHDTGCTLRVYRKEVAKSLDIGGEMHRYILALLRWKGFSIGEVVVNHRARINGKTKYGYSKAVRGFVDLIYMWFIQKYYQRPLHIFGATGVGSFGIGLLIESVLVYLKVASSIDLSSTAWFTLGFFFMGTGLFLFTFGIVIDLLMKIYLATSHNERRYYIREILG